MHPVWCKTMLPEPSPFEGIGLLTTLSRLLPCIYICMHINIHIYNMGEKINHRWWLFKWNHAIVFCSVIHINQNVPNQIVFMVKLSLRVGQIINDIHIRISNMPRLNDLFSYSIYDWCKIPIRHRRQKRGEMDGISSAMTVLFNDMHPCLVLACDVPHVIWNFWSD